MKKSIFEHLPYIHIHCAMVVEPCWFPRAVCGSLSAKCRRQHSNRACICCMTKQKYIFLKEITRLISSLLNDTVKKLVIIQTLFKKSRRMFFPKFCIKFYEWQLLCPALQCWMLFTCTEKWLFSPPWRMAALKQWAEDPVGSVRWVILEVGEFLHLIDSGVWMNTYSHGLWMNQQFSLLPQCPESLKNNSLM